VQHIPPIRLSLKAETKGDPFTKEEITHLQECEACLDLFRKLVREHFRERTEGRKNADPSPSGDSRRRSNADK
jgi:hypothetical protein